MAIYHRKLEIIRYCGSSLMSLTKINMHLLPVSLSLVYPLPKEKRDGGSVTARRDGGGGEGGRQEEATSNSERGGFIP